ncbi:hypothetical protein ZWY2020_020022 [Hordeum vulgare]|nr:hypothetical protein ZWY2020_020022 [Hordeum vulgare]
MGSKLGENISPIAAAAKPKTRFSSSASSRFALGFWGRGFRLSNPDGCCDSRLKDTSWGQALGRLLEFPWVFRGS